MTTNSIPYVQDTDQWVAYYLDMAEKHTLDLGDGYAVSNLISSGKEEGDIQGKKR